MGLSQTEIASRVIVSQTEEIEKLRAECEQMRAFIRDMARAVPHQPACEREHPPYLTTDPFCMRCRAEILGGGDG